jgi:hypothetical protein
MPTKELPLKLNGLNNRAKDFSLPKGVARNAVNVIFDDTGNIRFPRPGKTKVFSGTKVHSVYSTHNQTLFVDNGSLKRLEDPNRATTLLTSVGDDPLSYDTDGTWIYFCSKNVRGKLKGLENVTKPWGVAMPPRNPDVSARDTGGMYAGDYRVVITYITEDGEEGGCRNGALVSVSDGGGILLTNFPTPPSYVSHFGVYVTEVNSKDFYLYGEYPISATFTVQINRLTPSGLKPTVTLKTQFKFPPLPEGRIVIHHGKLYYMRGNKLYWTDAHNFGLQSRGSYKVFKSDLKNLISTPNVLYAGTSSVFGKITNIDGEGGAMFEPLQVCGGVPGTEYPDPNGRDVYALSERGFLAASPEALSEITFENAALPMFTSGCCTVLTIDGLEYLVGSFRGGVQSSLGDTDYNAAELARGSL